MGVSSNMATPSPMFSKVTRSSAWRCASSSVRSRSARKLATLSDRDHGLLGEGLQQRDLAVGIAAAIAATQSQMQPIALSVAHERDRHI